MDNTFPTPEETNITEIAAETVPGCLNIKMPFCEVFVSDDDCDPKLIEYHYKPGDLLYRINRTQYDTIECYYTEEEYRHAHDPKDCFEVQNEGKGCIIDDSPICNLMLDERDCTVSYTRAYCDERLLELNKQVGDSLPGIWNSHKNQIDCFYTLEERSRFLKKHELECKSGFKDLDNICFAQRKNNSVSNY